MPRNSHKKRLLNPHKSQLLFVGAPINGPKHEYGPQLQSAIHPKSFISEKQQQSGAPCTSWVSPQFNSLENTTVSRRKAPDLGFPQTRRANGCKYIPLSFEATTAGSQHQRENFSSSRTKNDRLVSSDGHSKQLRETPRRTHFPRKGVERRMATRVISISRRSEVSKKLQFHKNGNRTPKDSVHTPNTSLLVPEPPNVETPEMPHCSSMPPSNLQHLLFPPNQAKTPPRTENTNVPVKDTPEKDYGLRVTWRRRKGLMKLLTDRGLLLPADAGVASDWT
ncbi:RAD9, HUS1, RAD1-interacting nuclear orphan protein 1-like [Sinocyclocheilus anshuiensis]|uniref:RAD9, HUS1, RAD1-interacting nuclear orphan protein 1-like n=1 Tax=Sinocyclocheilus anshuiensis TaxID=1608454 RepID=A0A671T7T9_9TELE|nr:PREDICTED: RAD9, HUS1, RAD1-interacting nuclear orphan protein 1-like [Sinocyclocheilus anshuiensis]